MTREKTTYQFCCSTDTETLDWITAFQQVAFKNIPTNPMIEEYNDIYCTSDEGIFSVKLVETETSKRCKLEEKNYKLVISESGIQLMDNSKKLLKWPFMYVRKYGYRDNRFSFEAGRKCASGEGTFLFDCCNEQEIYRCLLLKIKSLKKSLQSPGIMSSSTMNLNEAQYHAALSMEAGSRSPLPPTPSSSSDNLTDTDYSIGSQNSQKPLLFSSIYNNFSTNSGQFSRLPSSIIKPKPEKPPRKYNLLGPNEAKSEMDYIDELCTGSYRKLDVYTSPEFSRKSTESHNEDEKHPYDLVEVRSDAWRTHGLDTVIHTERKDRPSHVTSERNDISDINFSRLVSDDDNSDDENSNKLITNRNEEFDERVSVDDNRRQSNNENDSNFPYETMKSQNTTTKDSTPVITSPIIHHNLTKFDSTGDYDQLEYFGSLHKLNNKSGYKKIKPFIYGSPENQILSQTGQQKTKEVKEADYEFIEDVSSIRLADESSRGYGVIRKKSNSTTTTTGPQDKTLDNNEYAIVSKPKRI